MSLLVVNRLAAQDEDSVKVIDEVTVSAFGQRSSVAAASVKAIIFDPPLFNNSMVTALNSVPGFRMEERSPGSYRINIRGSSIRSPFGVRNVKIYWGDIPLTDPGGNTYFNQLAVNNIDLLTVFRGPASSMYGAGTGGLITMTLPRAATSQIEAEYFGGSYGSRNFLTSGNWKQSLATHTASFAHNETDGYRKQSSMRRNNFSWNSKIKWEKGELTAALLFSDLYYQTPGALTLEEFNLDPSAARPKAGAFPSAEAVNAGIWQKNIMGGVTLKQLFGREWSNTTTVYGAYAQVKNSAVRNFEQRSEPHFGGRSVVEYTKKLLDVNTLKWSAGAEAQQGYSSIRVADNKNGHPDTLRTDDDVSIGTYSVFTQAILELEMDWIFSTGVSFNQSRLNFERQNEYPVINQRFKFSNEVAPRFTAMRRTKIVDLWTAVSKGFSPPSVAEILPSTTIINKDLKAEHGWNYELGLRKSLSNGLYMDLAGFYLDLKDALIQRRDASGADYFENAGSTKQRGVEFAAGYSKYSFNNEVLDYLNIATAYSYSHFRYGNFVKEGNNYSGKTLPGIPSNTLNASVAVAFKRGVYFSTNFYAASAHFLNDANTQEMNGYQVLSGKLGYKMTWRKLRADFYVGGDNLLNETYSLGNDINAAAGRYYNAAPKRNYYLGVAFRLKK